MAAKPSATGRRREAPALKPHTTLSEDEFRKLIESGEEKGIINVLVTPDLALVMMEYNDPGTTNRPLSQSDVSLYLDEIKHDRWINTGDPLIFTDNKLQNNGQHRLAAIIASGRPVIMDLRFGISRAAFSATDAGRRRTGSDVVRMLGLSNAHNLAAVARTVIAYDQGLPSAAFRKVGPNMIANAITRWPDIVEGLNYGVSLTKPLKNSSILTIGFFGHRTTTPDRMREFFSILHSGEGSANQPPHRLQKFVTRHGASRSGIDRNRFLAVGIQALNAWNKGDELKSDLEWAQSKPFPVVDSLKL